MWMTAKYTKQGEKLVIPIAQDRVNRAETVDEWVIEDRWSWLDFEVDRTKAGGLENYGGGFLEEIPARAALPGDRNNPNFDANSSQLGRTFPRISPVSVKSLDYRYGNALINWAREILQVDLLPWQEFLLREGLVRMDDRFRYRTLLAIVARQNGKTLVTAIRILGGLCLFGERFVVGSANNRGTALEAMTYAYDLADQAGLKLTKMRRAAGQEEFWVEGGRYKLVSATTGGARGLSGVDLVVLDELRQMRHWESYAALDKIRRVRRDAQVWAITTEGDIHSVVMNKIQAIGRDAIEAGETSPVGYFEWSAPPGLKAGDVTAWAHANPALGYILDEDVVRAEFQTDPPRVFEVEVLCRKVAQIAGWVEPSEWDACTTRDQFPIDQPFVLAVDAVPELRHVSIVAGALVGKTHHIELVETFTGPSALTYAEQRLDGLLNRWKPAQLVTTQKSPCEPTVAKLAATANITHSAVRPAEWARACRAFYAAVRARQVSHPGGTGISAALALTQRGPDGLVSQVHRINDSADNDAALAAVLALWAPTQLKPDQPLNWTIY